MAVGVKGAVQFLYCRGCDRCDALQRACSNFWRGCRGRCAFPGAADADAVSEVEGLLGTGLILSVGLSGADGLLNHVPLLQCTQAAVKQFALNR